MGINGGVSSSYLEASYISLLDVPFFVLSMVKVRVSVRVRFRVRVYGKRVITDCFLENFLFPWKYLKKIILRSKF